MTRAGGATWQRLGSVFPGAVPPATQATAIANLPCDRDSAGRASLASHGASNASVLATQESRTHSLRGRLPITRPDHVRRPANPGALSNLNSRPRAAEAESFPRYSESA